MNYSAFLGVDVSKQWIDAHLCYADKNRQGHSARFDNDYRGFKAMVKWIKERFDSIDRSKLLMCLEHTGVYSIPLCEFANQQNMAYTLVSGQTIAQSCGLRRNKSDRLDAKIISGFIRRSHDEIRHQTLPKQSLRQLKAILKMRDRLKKTIHRYKVSNKELRSFDPQVGELLEQTNSIMLQNAKAQLKAIEKQLKAFVKADEQLQQNYDLLVSVPGVGRVTAWYVLMRTQNFCAFTNARQFANYIGVSPCQKSSGQRRGRAKLSRKAETKFKTLLQNGVQSALQRCKEYQLFFEKQLGRGKNKYSIYNMIRRKIVDRMFSVIKRRTKYVDVMAYAAAR